MPAFMKLGDIKGDVSSSDAPAVHDIAIAEQTDNSENIEVIVKVLDGTRSAEGGTGVSTYYDLTDTLELGDLGGATTGVEYTLTVTDTETGHVKEREGGLIYSGESGGMNESGTGATGHYTQLVWDDTNAAAGDQLGKPKFEDIKLTGGVAGHDGEPGDLTTDAVAADGRAFIIFEGRIPDPVPSTPDAAGPMRESMETMKKTWKDASSTPEGKTALDDAAPFDLTVESDTSMYQGLLYYSATVLGDTYPSANAGYDYDAIGRLATTTNAPPAERQAILKMLTADYMGDGDPSAAHWHAGGVSWGLDRIDQHVGGGDLSDWQSNYGAGGGGTGKVSVQDISINTSVPKAAEHDTVELVTFGFSFDKIEVDHGGGLNADDLALFDADAAAPGNTYLGMTTIDQGVLEAGHSTMTLSFQYYIW